MALDRYDDGGDGPTDVKPEQHQWHGGSGGDAPTARAEPAEGRTSDGLIWSGWPRLGSPGVVKNPQET